MGRLDVEEPILAAQELVLDERGEEVDGSLLLGLRLEQPRFEDYRGRTSLGEEDVMMS